MSSRMQIVRAGSHISSNLLYLFDRSYGRRAVKNKQQARRACVSMNLLEPTLHLLEYLRRSVGNVRRVGNCYDIGKVEGAMFEEGKVQRRRRANLHVALLR